MMDCNGVEMMMGGRRANLAESRKKSSGRPPDQPPDYFVDCRMDSVSLHDEQR
jgi:hypothetical protein